MPRSISDFNDEELSRELEAAISSTVRAKPTAAEMRRYLALEAESKRRQSAESMSSSEPI